MFCSRRVLQRWSFALFLLCSPAPLFGRPIDALSSRIKRSVSHAQMMHDKGRTLQDYKRRMWLQGLLDGVHTAEIRDLPVRTTGAAAGSPTSGAGVGLPGVSLGINLSTTGTTLHSKPPGGTKNLPLSFRPEEEEGTNLPQETNKSQPYKDGVLKAPGKKKKKGRSGKRREGEKRRRRARSLSWRWDEEPGSGFHLEEEETEAAEAAAAHASGEGVYGR
uniref:Parathyroid hormone-like hormone a n=1 Tax=Cynoglossus semilaevis TaxID=244447 RepID=A0A3P8UYW0_CYNSE